MNRTYGIIGAVVAAAAIVAGVIISLQSFDAEKVLCDGIADARAELQAQYDAGVAASVQMFADARVAAEDRLSQCLRAEPVDPCADLQKARDAAVNGYESIMSPPDSAPHEEFQKYFEMRESAYNTYKNAKSALDQCRAANPPKGDVPYAQSDTKVCFDAYDASMQTTQDTFTRDTQTMRAALTAALATLDAREKACNPPTGKDQFTIAPNTDNTDGEGGISVNIQNCQLLDSDSDAELIALRKQAASLETEIQSLQTTIENAEKRVRGLESDLNEADTYIPPESTKTQFEGALNALRGERKANIQSAIDFYKSLIERKQSEKTAREGELRDVEAKITERLDQIQKENEDRQRNYPTALHQSKPDKCDYYHCHGMLCGMPDPEGDGCGHGATSEEDVDCKTFIEKYFQAAGG